MFERVRDAQIATRGPDHADTLSALDDLGVAYQFAGRHAEALTLYERVRDAQIATLGAEHPATLTTLHNIAAAYYATGRLAEAIAMFERVRDARVAKLGPDHPETLTTLNHLATAYWNTRQLEKSVPLFEDVLKRREAKLGRQHIETQRVVANLGVNYIGSGRLNEAIALLEEAYQAARRFPTLRWVALTLMDSYAKAGENEKLAVLIHEELREARKTLPSESSELAEQLAQLSLVLMGQKQWTEAELLLRESLAIREKTQPEMWSTFSVKSLLGGALLGQRKYAEAEPLLVAGYAGMKQREKTIPPLAGIRIVQALDRLIELYTATKKPDELTKWRAERAKYPATAAETK